jgi:hypothetical protein
MHVMGYDPREEENTVRGGWETQAGKLNYITAAFSRFPPSKTE